MLNYNPIPNNQQFVRPNKIDQTISESSDEIHAYKTNNIVKKVHFAEFPIIYKSVPWFNESNDNQSSGDLDSIFISEQSQLIFESSLKNDFTQLRTPYNRSQQMNFFGFIIIIFCFIFLFSLIWWIAEKLLMIEVEQQITNSLNKNHNRF